MPWSIGFAICLLVIVIGVNRKLHLGLIMLASGLFLLVALGLPAVQLVEVARLTLANRATQVLLLSIIMIEILGNLLKQTGSLQRMITYLGRLVGDMRLLTVLLPALVGVLTVPGGAIFAAPMVEQVGEKSGLSPVKQASVNLWFRHALYFSFPLFPSIILAAELSGVNVSVIAGYNLFLTASALVIAFFIIFRGVSGKVPSNGGESESGVTGRREILSNLAHFGASIAPLAAVLILAIGFKIFFPLALAAGIGVALFANLPLKKGFPPELKRRFITMVLPGIKLKLALIVLGIMFFKQSLEYSGVTGLLGEAMLDTGLPMLLLMFVFPALIGMIMGDNNAGVAIVFPLFIPLLNAAGPAYQAQVAFLFFSSAWGHIFTPTHPCFSLTVEYFKVTYSRVIRQLLLPAAAVALLAVVQMLLLNSR